MGFKPKRKIYRLTWTEESDFYGFEVDMRPISVGRLMSLVELADTAFDGKDLTRGNETLNELYDFVSSNIESWNLEDEDDRPVEPSVEALKDQELEMLMAIVQGWVSVMTEVPDPLGGTSTDGKPSVELSMIPVELSEPLLA